LKRIVFRLISNVFTNWFIIRIGKEEWITSRIGYWQNFKAQEGQTDQETAGFSHEQEVQKTIDETHKELIKIVEDRFPDRASVLDIGCGTGLYLKDFSKIKGEFILTGIDVNQDMLDRAKKNCPDATLIKESIMECSLERNNIDIVYSIGAIQYFGRKNLPKIIKKLSGMMAEKGILFISYPHAVSLKDTWYPDINYIQYSPKRLNKLLSPYFNVLDHFHTTRKDFIGKYDQSPFNDINSEYDKSYVNSSIVIAQKSE